MSRYAFSFAPAYRVPALLFGIVPRTAWVDLTSEHLSVRYGPWALRTSLHNITAVERTGGFAWLKTVGPPHLSFSDRGISFTTNGDDAACVSFRRPVAGIDPTRRIKHPGATLSVQDVPGFIAEIEHYRSR